MSALYTSSVLTSAYQPTSQRAGEVIGHSHNFQKVYKSYLHSNKCHSDELASEITHLACLPDMLPEKVATSSGGKIMYKANKDLEMR